MRLKTWAGRVVSVRLRGVALFSGPKPAHPRDYCGSISLGKRSWLRGQFNLLGLSGLPFQKPIDFPARRIQRALFLLGAVAG